MIFCMYWCLTVRVTLPPIDRHIQHAEHHSYTTSDIVFSSNRTFKLYFDLFYDIFYVKLLLTSGPA